jgi:PadR family transcriptional regulator AphA
MEKRMPMARGAAEPLRFVLLGLLLEGPSHGYDLARHFGRGTALGEIVHISQAHLYALLARLERDGLIAGEQQDAGARPQRRVFRLTGEGEVAVLAWVDEPVGHPREMRIEFPLKFYVARRLGADRARALVERQRRTFEEYQDRLASEGGPLDDLADPFVGLMRASRVGRVQAALDWLDLCEPLIG